MAATRANTVGTAEYRGGALREDLIDKMFEQSRAETPFVSSIGKTTASLPRHEWQTYNLEDPEDNAQSGSFEFNTTNADDFTTRRLSNYTQVFAKTIHIEGSLLRSDPAGASNWYAKTLEVRMKEIKRDFERRALIRGNGANTAGYNAGATTTSREMGGVFAYAGNWVAAAAGTVSYNAGTNVAINAANTTTRSRGGNITAAGVVTAGGGSFNTGGANVDGSGTVVYSAGGTTNFSLAADDDATLGLFNQGFEVAFNNGGMIKAAQVPTRMKAAVSNALIGGNGGAAERRASEMAKRVNLAVDSVVTEFGFDVSIMPNYIMDQHASDANSSIVWYNPDTINVAKLQDYSIEVDGTARYGKGSIIFCDKTLEVEKPNDIIATIGVAR